MDFQSIVDSFDSMACVVSVETGPDDAQTRYRIVAGNSAYVSSIENPAPGVKMLSNHFVPNTEYTDYLTRDLNFEDYCYRSAVEKKCLHSYVHPDRMDVWFNMSFLPLNSDNGNIFYCIYVMEISFKHSSEKMSNISSDIATSVLDTCIRLRGTNDFRATMNDVIRGIGELCGAEHCCILVMDEADRSCYVLGESLSAGTSLLPMNTYVNKDFYYIAESWMSTIAGSNCLIAKNAQDMLIVKERNPIWYESLTSAGAHNIVLFPLKSGNQLLGYMWAINFDATRSIRIKETLEVTTFILGSELGNYLLLDKLKTLGTKDMLTGVMNRNEMNNYVDTLSRGEKHSESSVAVLFIDMNGLKWINDTKGHVAGDILLKDAASVILQVFEEEEIFRAGGDEFAVIALDVSEEELQSRIDTIRKIGSEYEHLSMAIGSCVEMQSRNIRMALRIADERMYEDKRRFYEENPYGLVTDKFVRMSPDDVPVSENDRDALTGLLDMDCFFRVADKHREKMHIKGEETCLLYFNLCGLKYYNKKYGYSEGEQLIKEMAMIIESEFGKDRCARMGQDNFAAVVDRDGIEDKLNNVFKELKRANSGKTLYVRVGIYPDSMGMIESALAYDRAKYACNLYREDNCSYYRYFDRDMLEMELRKQYVIDNLDRAIAENWITAFYQPIVRSTNMRVSDEEALARWIDPERGMLSPAEFIPILEETKLIYKVDLRMVDIILEKMKNQRHAGLFVVPISVNLSRTDFEVCDIVQEICNRIDASGLPRKLLTIEITESTIGSNFDFMKEQIERFRELGFSVWMDDFGSGYSSLDLLQEIHFDLIKFDMRFMRQFSQKPESRVILSELMRMAVFLDTETVVEGVETEEQVKFLSEIGCTKMQGYYFCKPIPLSAILDRYKKGVQIGFEDPSEADYNRAVSVVNLYDLGAVSSDDTGSVRQFFNSQPMFVVEYDGINVTVVRCNRAYHELVLHKYGIVKLRQKVPVSELRGNLATAFYEGIRQCEKEGHKVFIDETLENGDVLHALIRKVMTNPVTGTAAFAVAVLGISQHNEDALSFSDMARALSSDYIFLYHVNLQTETYTEYSFSRDKEGITTERSGTTFFESARSDALDQIAKEDQEGFIAAFNKENICSKLREDGVFTCNYRLLIDGVPHSVAMKAVNLGKDDNQLIIGVRLNTAAT